jgi:thiamine biosynthesis protein ThiS
VRVTVNGEPREVAEGTTVADLLNELGVKVQHCAVELNLQLVPRQQHAAQTLASGDRMEVVTLVGGG